MALMREAIPDMRTTVKAVIVEGEVAAARIVTSGTMKRPIQGLGMPLGPIELSITMLYRFVGSQIAEEWFDVDASTRWGLQQDAVKTTKSALSIGWHPDVPGLPMSPADVRRGLEAAKEKLEQAGYPTDLCLLRNEPSDFSLVEQTLRAKRYDAIVVGAGVRLPPQHHLLFEKIVNLVHAGAPQAKICFNATPLDTSDAVLRWISVSEEKPR
jgi:SnoaL-like polyketide cyclase